MARVAPCFARRETRLTCRRMVNGLLSELDDYNCWTLAEAAGHGSPCPMQHLLSRARCDDRAMLDAAADWTVEQLNGEQGGTGGDAILVVDETCDANSSTDAVGAARQYSGASGGSGCARSRSTWTFATPTGHAVIGRRLYLGAGWAGDDERRTVAGVPDDVVFATKPDLAIALIRHAVAAGVHAQYVTADEVYGLDLAPSIRELGAGYVMAVRSNRMVTLTSAAASPETTGHLIRPSWARMRTGCATKGAKDYHWAMIEFSPTTPPAGTLTGTHSAGAPPPLHPHLAYFRAGPRPVSLADLVDVVSRAGK